MPFDALKYLRDRRIPYVTEGPDVGANWIGLRCPFPHRGGTTDHGTHGGFNLEDGHYSCWICGGHSLESVIMTLERCEYHEACRLVIEYSYDHVGQRRSAVIKVDQQKNTRLDLPPGTMPLQAVHKRYLEKRRFDPDLLEQKYKLMGTLGAGRYAGRIIAPIYLNGTMVSYQGRDITDRQAQRYKACRRELEIINHQSIFYNLDHAGDTAIIVEGITDVWRLGDGAVATFGTAILRSQVRLAVEQFKRVFILFDSEPDAQKKAERFCNQLSAAGLAAVNISIKHGDPGDLPQAEADALKKELLT